jgi:hypothetical protein
MGMIYPHTQSCVVLSLRNIICPDQINVLIFYLSIAVIAVSSACIHPFPLWVTKQETAYSWIPSCLVGKCHFLPWHVSHPPWLSVHIRRIPQTAWPHWGVLAVTVKAWCSIEVVSGAFGIFPVNLPKKSISWHVHMHFDCAACKFPLKMPLVTCPCAFRLRKLAQNAGRGTGPGFSL